MKKFVHVCLTTCVKDDSHEETKMSIDIKKSAENEAAWRVSSERKGCTSLMGKETRKWKEAQPLICGPAVLHREQPHIIRSRIGACMQIRGCPPASNARAVIICTRNYGSLNFPNNFWPPRRSLLLMFTSSDSSAGGARPVVVAPLVTVPLVLVRGRRRSVKVDRWRWRVAVRGREASMSSPTRCWGGDSSFHCGL